MHFIIIFLLCLGLQRYLFPSISLVIILHIITCISNYRRGFGLVIGFNEHLQIVNASNNSAIPRSHTLQFTTAHTKSSQSAVSSPTVAW
jgi:hypothetical protein